MEVFTGGGDHELPNDVVLFPDTHISPFSDTFSDHHHLLPPPQPPQKLRPVRFNGRSFSHPKPPSWHPEPETHSGDNISPNPSILGESYKEPVNDKKRKRKSMKSYIKSMVNTVIEKQEEMYRNLYQLLERKETESIMREQAWRQQELARAKRNEQDRKQEISRNLALISFIQKSLGQDIQIPNPLHTDNKQCDDNQNQENLNCYCAGNDDIDTESDIHNKRWPKSEVQALITVRTAIHQNGSKGFSWEEVAVELSGMGYNRTGKKCKEKWDNINKYYRRTKENGSARKSNSCTYFKELEMLYKTDFSSANSHSGDSSVMGLD